MIYDCKGWKIRWVYDCNGWNLSEWKSDGGDSGGVKGWRGGSGGGEGANGGSCTVKPEFCDLGQREGN